MKKFNSSAKFQRRVSHFFTYLFLILLSIIIIYPLLITASTAFKSGNIAAFSLDLSSDWTLDNFTRLFSETLYGTWYKNTLVISILTMAIQVTVVTLAGYTYSRYRFVGRKSSLMFFLGDPDGSDDGCIDRFLCDGVSTRCIRSLLVLDDDLYRGRNPNEYLVDEGVFRYSPNRFR